MGVTGLWRLIEPAGKPVPVETLENKVLAVDISIWLHQVVKGYQDAKGAPIPNAHLIGLFQRLCKLLYFRIKPVFVFDGAFPDLKKETIAKRQDHKQKYNSESERLKRELAILLTKKTVIGGLLGKQISPKKSNPVHQNDDDLFKLPALPEKEASESESEDETSSSSSSTVDLHSIDLESKNFKTLPTKEKYDLLLELKETRKMNSWGKLHELPKKSDNFSDFQLQRLLKRRKVQECLEETEKEMGDTGMSLNELESLLNEEGIDTKIESLPTRRIASNNSTRFLLINDVKQALENAKKRDIENQASTSRVDTEDKVNKKDELEEDLEKAIKMSLEGDSEANTSVAKTDDSWTTYNSDSEYSSDSDEDDGCEAPDMSSAKAYIKQYCDFTDKAIDDIVASSRVIRSKKKLPSVNKIIEEINKEKSIIVNNVELSSSDDECQNEVVDLNTTADSDIFDDHIDATQKSVIVLENPSQTIITLDSSLEESIEVSNQKETGDMIKSDANDHDMPKDATPIADHESNEQSDSSDNDFEDVPEIDEKPIVQLTLDIDGAPEDDIFADIFTKPAKEFVNKDIKQGNVISAPQIDMNIPKIPVKNEIVDEDDELQKAIMMSLECIDDNEHPITTQDIVAANSDTDIVSSKRDKLEKDKELYIETPSNGISKTVESLNKILAEKTKADNILENNKSTSQRKDNVAPLSKEQLNDMVEEIQTEEQDLLQEKGRLDRVGRNITEQMTKEAQELLQIFGIPYIVAPTEAEAQCAFLESVNLTDGTITDDSDIWLFGGRNVYKNFFNQKKHVLQFLADKIEKSFNLSREQLVLLALLVGSDYTTGIAGVGPVTALEILALFPFNKRKSSEATKQDSYSQMITGLQEFKQWVKGGKRTDNTSLKKKLRNISLNDDFPSVRVVQAYLEPNVEKSKDKFTWGELDITILRDYTKAKFGWSQHKLDEIVTPVLKRMVERKSQKSMQDYFKKKTNFQSLEEQMSKRVKAAVQRMGPENSIVDTDTSKKPSKRKPKNTSEPVAGPSKTKKKKTDESVLKDLCVRVVSEVKDGKSEIDIKINKTDRYQEIIPQREKDKQGLLQNKMKAIELFRKTNIDKKKKTTKRKPLVPKDKAELSESDSD